jgi:hypothetical protein
VGEHLSSKHEALSLKKKKKKANVVVQRTLLLCFSKNKSKIQADSISGSYSSFPIFILSIYLSIYESLGFELRALHLLGRHTLTSFCFIYFGDRVSHLCSGQLDSQSFCLCFQSSYDERHRPPHPAFIGGDVVS